jgi:V/A-type H+-transporting ATPase subunit E
MANDIEHKTKMITHGVESLINRLKNDGVQAGKTEADKIIKDAQNQANKILNEARMEADNLLNHATKKIQQERQAALDALEIAARNMRLEIRQRMTNRLKEEVQRLVHKDLDNETTIHQLIQLLTIDSAEKLKEFTNSKIEIYLPEKALDFEKIRNHPELLVNDPLKQLVQGTTNVMFKSGIELKINTDKKNEVGIKVRVVDEDIEIDLTEEAISALLLKHLQPRFRALLEGLLR